MTLTTTYDYELASGMLTKEVVETGNSDRCLVTSYDLDAVGNRKSVTQRNCQGLASVVPGGQIEALAPTGLAAFLPRTTTFTYTADKRFVTTSSNDLGEVYTTENDGRFGSKTSTKDPNTVQTTWAYDGLGRKVRETYPDGTMTKWSYVYCAYTYSDFYGAPRPTPAGASPRVRIVVASIDQPRGRR